MSYEHAKTQRRGESYVNSHANKMMTSQANIHAAFFLNTKLTPGLGIDFCGDLAAIRFIAL